MEKNLTQGNGGIYYAESHGPVIAVAGKSANGVDYRNNHATIRSGEKSLLAALTGLAPRNIVFLNQVHGGRILVLEDMPEDDLPSAGDADAMITSLPGLCLVIRTADCVPVFLYDHRKKIMGAVHSGWKGTRLEIARNTLRLMRLKFGSMPEDITAHLLPSIGPESYRINSDVYELFSRGRFEKEGNLYLDLWENVTHSLRDEGVREENIVNYWICTLKEQAYFFSHRGGDAGRNLNFAFMK